MEVRTEKKSKPALSLSVWWIVGGTIALLLLLFVIWKKVLTHNA